MSTDKRVVIIGAGVVGMFTAFELVRDGGTQVTVLEQAHPGDGSSGRSVGMVETQYFSRGRVEVLAWGRDMYKSLEVDHGLGFTHGGYLRLGRTTDDIATFERSLAHQAEYGVTDACLLAPAEMAKRWPQLMTADLTAGLLGTWDGHVDGYEVAQLLANLVRAGDGKVVSRTRMMGAEPTARGWRVVTDKGDYEADLVVNAAGPWAGHVGDRLNAPVPLIPQLAGAALVKLAKPAPPLPFVMDYRPGSGTDGVYFRSERTDQLIAGLHTDEIISGAVSPDVALGPVTNEVIERMVNLLANRLHEADNLAIGRSWTGIYPMTPDHEPIVGLHPTADGIVCALGAGGSGIQLSPAMGRLAADVIGGRSGRRFAQEDDWAPSRFTHPHNSIRAGEAS